MRKTHLFPTVFVLIFASFTVAQEASGPVRGSLVEDRAARKLIQAGDGRMEADETAKAIEIWQSVIERYPRSKVRYQAHMKLGDYFLERDRAYDRGRVHFESVASEENRDEEQRAEATLKMGVCFFHVRNYAKCFQVMRSVIEEFPVSEQVNQAYYYIGLGHFQLGHYGRAISALEKVGTALSSEDDKVEKLHAGKRFFIRIEDADLAVLSPGEAVEIVCQASSGDREVAKCYPVGRNVRLVLGSIPTRLGNPIPDSGKLDVTGNDKVEVRYTDKHTAEKMLDREVLRTVTIVGNANVQITDGAYNENVQGVVLGKSVNVQITDADRDNTDSADGLTAAIEVYRRKTEEEIDAELAKAAASSDSASLVPLDDESEGPQIDPYKLIDRVQIQLTEVAVAEDAVTRLSGGAQDDESVKAPEDSTSTSVDNDAIHSGVFRTTVPLVKTDEVVEGDAQLQARAGDRVRLVYLDDKHLGDGVRQVHTEARCLEGNIGGVRVTKAIISDHELRLQTSLKTASALTNIGDRYKEFGLKDNANSKYEQALNVCEENMNDARQLGGRILEETYVQLWKIYYAMDRLSLAAAMCERLQREFPNSGFVDDALLQLADVERTQGTLNRAIGIYNRLVNMETSQLRGDAQFGIAECYDQMAEAAEEESPRRAQFQDRAFQEYKKVFDRFPDSGRVGEAVAKMANHYYQQRDYARAVDTFESVLSSHPDAKFLDVILFNYGRCLYRMKRMSEARRRFDQLIGEFPESDLASDAKKISDALAKRGF